MSNRQSSLTTVEFEPVPAKTAPPPGGASLLLTVIYPAIVIGIELVTRFCAQVFFDPMPTNWHVVAVCFVPATNLLVWLHLRNGTFHKVKWLAFANGVAIAVGGFYALVFAPLLPLAIIGILVAIGLLPLAPLASFAGALWLRRAFRSKHRTERRTRETLGGVPVGVVLLLALNIPSAATRLGIQWAASGVPSEREQGLTLLRTIGDDDLLLRLCYDTAGRPTGLLSALVMLLGRFDPAIRQVAQSTAEVREIY